MYAGCPASILYNIGVSIQENWQKFKSWEGRVTVVLALLMVIVAVVSFVSGRMSVVLSEENNKPYIPIQAQVIAPTELVSPITASDVKTGGYVASKSGTKYHLPWCGSAQQIKESNKIWFATKAEAEAAGYTPAANCKGI